MLDDLAHAPAERARDHIDDLAEDRLRHPSYLPLATAVGAARRCGAGLRPAPGAGGAHVRPGHFDLLLDAEDGLFEVELQPVAQVTPASRPAALASAALAPKKHVEEVAEARPGESVAEAAGAADTAKPVVL